jgi:CheY-like chemotaxis protein
MRRSLRTLLEAQDNWKVCDEASDGSEALSKFSDDKFDVVVLDFQMPVMDGLEAAHKDNKALSSDADPHGYHARIIASARGCCATSRHQGCLRQD